MRAERGGALIEALISLLVLALGVLAMARLQVGNLAESRHTNARAMAIQLAADLKERMLANAAAITANPSSHPYIIGFGAVPAASGCGTTACSARAMAARDLAAWKAQIAALLPDGDAQVFLPPDSPGQLGVLIAWRAIGSQHAATAAATGDTESQERDRQANAVWHSLDTEGTGASDVECLEGHLCHLIYLHP